MAKVGKATAGRPKFGEHIIPQTKELTLLFYFLAFAHVPTIAMRSCKPHLKWTDGLQLETKTELA